MTAILANELFSAVKTDNGWMEEADPEEKIPASTFQSVLRRFMFRYLSVDHLRSDVQLHLYLTDARLVIWPKDAVKEDIVDNYFPPNLLLQHSFATYMLLTQVRSAPCFPGFECTSYLCRSHCLSALTVRIKFNLDF